LGEANEDAYTDRERAKLIFEYLKVTRKDKDGNLIFKVGGKEVCTPAFLRILGVTADIEESKAPGQWLRLIKGYKDGQEESMLLSKKDLKLDKQSRQTRLIRRATTYILQIIKTYSDSLPSVSTTARHVPYRHFKDMCQDYNYSCDVHKT
jgi:hypothetical protein